MSKTVGGGDHSYRILLAQHYDTDLNNIIVYCKGAKVKAKIKSRKGKLQNENKEMDAEKSISDNSQPATNN